MRFTQNKTTKYETIIHLLEVYNIYFIYYTKRTSSKMVTKMTTRPAPVNRSMLDDKDLRMHPRCRHWLSLHAWQRENATFG